MPYKTKRRTVKPGNEFPTLKGTGDREWVAPRPEHIFNEVSPSEEDLYLMPKKKRIKSRNTWTF